MSNDAPVPSLRILRAAEVEVRTGLGDAQRTKLERAGDFPARVALSERRVGWIESEIDAWIRNRMQRRMQAAVDTALRVARMPPGARARWRRAHPDAPVA